MCDDCEYTDGHPVSLTRRYPKNKVTPSTTPAEYLEGWDIARGQYDLVDKSDVRANDYEWRSPVVGYYTTYRGARDREYSQPMFTFKPSMEGCGGCNDGSEPDWHLPRQYATKGCQCGNVAYPGRDCEIHPLPSVDSRWIRLQQVGAFCNHCESELPQETWDPTIRHYCNHECKTAWEIAYKRRQEQWEKERLRRRA